jgi:hypothetical protein
MRRSNAERAVGTAHEQMHGDERALIDAHRARCSQPRGRERVERRMTRRARRAPNVAAARVGVDPHWPILHTRTPAFHDCVRCVNSASESTPTARWRSTSTRDTFLKTADGHGSTSTAIARSYSNVLRQAFLLSACQTGTARRPPRPRRADGAQSASATGLPSKMLSRRRGSTKHVWPKWRNPMRTGRTTYRGRRVGHPRSVWRRISLRAW